MASSKSTSVPPVLFAGIEELGVPLASWAETLPEDPIDRLRLVAERHHRYNSFVEAFQEKDIARGMIQARPRKKTKRSNCG